MTMGTTTQLQPTNRDDLEYAGFLQRIQARFDATEGPLFTTNVGFIWSIYLAAFQGTEERQYHNCRACQFFLERYGSLVTIDEEGVAHSALWHEDDAPARYKASIKVMRDLVEHSSITGVFLTTDALLGQPVAGGWTHYAVAMSPARVFTHARLSASQVAAALKQDYEIFQRGLARYTPAVVKKAVTLLESDQMYRADSVIALANWLAALYDRLATTRAISRRSNIVWSAVATAPAGWAHVSNTVLGTLLDDIADNVPFKVAKARWAEKLAPLKYQRPQAPPSAGNIATAEKIVNDLRAARALERRFATLDEIHAVWRPAPPTSPGVAGAGVFSHLRPKGSDPESTIAPNQATRITWVKFADTVLPKAQAIYYYTPPTGRFAAITAPVHADAPPIFQWDSETVRNPFAWYLYPSGSTASRWNLRAQEWNRVNAVTLQPNMWNGGFEHQGTGVMFILEGAVDSHCDELAIFPGTLRSEFREIRSTIEAYSKAGKLAGKDRASACGVIFQKAAGFGDPLLRVIVNGTT